MSDEFVEMMRESLEYGLTAQRGRPVRIRGLRETGFEFLSSFAARRLCVTLEGGEQLRVFCKDLNPMHQVAEARRVRGIDLERSRRELYMYREVLDAGRLATPRFYGHRWEESHGRLWLFIEDVGSQRLSHVGDFDLWIAAVRWLASFHATMPTTYADDAPLARHDPARFRGFAEQLAANPPAGSEAQHEVIRRALMRFDEIVDSLDEQPQGLLHCDYFGKNILIRPDDSARQIAVIDWETAAIGPIYRDLADFSAGRWTRAQRLAMWRAYRDQYSRDSGRELPWDPFCRDVASMALAQAIAWLAYWRDGERRHLTRCMAELERVVAEFDEP